MKRKPAVWRSKLLATFMVCALAAGAGAAHADVSFTIDKETLNDLLGALLADRVDVPLGSETAVAVYFDDMQITGLDPSAGDEGQGYILSSLKVRVPTLGLNLTVKPRISLNVVEKGGASMLELRFERLVLPMPLAGSIDIAALVPPIRYDADNVWLLAGARGNVPIDSRLKKIDLGRDAIRFMFAVEIREVGP
jgi:hypothetical protein